LSQFHDIAYVGEIPPESEVSKKDKLRKFKFDDQESNRSRVNSHNSHVIVVQRRHSDRVELDRYSSKHNSVQLNYMAESE